MLDPDRAIVETSGLPLAARSITPSGPTERQAISPKPESSRDGLCILIYRTIRRKLKMIRVRLN
jgi:hypothetical protein